MLGLSTSGDLQNQQVLGSSLKQGCDPVVPGLRKGERVSEDKAGEGGSASGFARAARVQRIPLGLPVYNMNRSGHLRGSGLFKPSVAQPLPQSLEDMCLVRSAS